jgi:hypothetical protein
LGIIPAGLRASASEVSDNEGGIGWHLQSMLVILTIGLDIPMHEVC